MTEDIERKARDRYVRHLLASKTNFRLLDGFKAESAYKISLASFSELEILKVEQPECKNVFLQLVTMIFDNKTRKFVTPGYTITPLQLSHVEKLRFRLKSTASIELLVTTPGNASESYYIFMEFMTIVKEGAKLISRKKLGWLVLPLKRTEHRIDGLFFADPKALETYELSTIAKILNSKVNFDIRIGEYAVPECVQMAVPYFYTTELPVQSSLSGWQAREPGLDKLVYITAGVFSLRAERLRLELGAELDTQVLAYMRGERKQKCKIIEKKLEVTFLSRFSKHTHTLNIDLNERTGRVVFGRQGNLVFHHIDGSRKSVVLFRLLMTLKPKSTLFKSNTQPITDLCVLHGYVFTDSINFDQKTQCVALNPLDERMALRLNGARIASGAAKLSFEVTKQTEASSNKKITMPERLKDEEEQVAVIEELIPETGQETADIGIRSIGNDILDNEIVQKELTDAELAYNELSHTSPMFEEQNEEALQTAITPVKKAKGKKVQRVTFKSLEKVESEVFDDFDEMFEEKDDDEEKSREEAPKIVEVDAKVTESDIKQPAFEMGEEVIADCRLPMKQSLKNDNQQTSAVKSNITEKPNPEGEDALVGELVTKEDKETREDHEHRAKARKQANRIAKSCTVIDQNQTDHDTNNRQCESLLLRSKETKENGPCQSRVISLLKDEIRTLKETKELNDRKVREYSENLKDMTKLVNEQMFIEEVVPATKHMAKSLRKGVERTNAIKQRDIDYSVELKDVNAQKMTIQLHSVTFNAAGGERVKPHNGLVMKMRSLSNEELRSQSGCYSLDTKDINGKHANVPVDITEKSLQYNRGKQLHIISTNGDGSKISIETDINPFKEQIDPRCIFFTHMHHIELMRHSAFEVVFADAESSFELYRCLIDCKLLLRQGKANHIAILNQPVLLTDKNANNGSPIEIGSATFKLISRIAPDSESQRAELYDTTNNLVDIEYIFNNAVKESSAHKVNKQVIKRKLAPTQENEADTNLKDIMTDSEKRKMFIVKKFKNNFLKQEPRPVDYEALKLEKLRTVLHEEKYIQKKSLVAFRGKRLYVPIKFMNNELGSSFTIKHTVFSGDSPEPTVDFRQLLEEHQVNEAVKGVNSYLSEFGPHNETLDAELVMMTAEFSCLEKQYVYILFSFTALEKDTAYSPTVEIINNEGKVVCGYRFNVKVKDNYNNRVYTAMNADPNTFRLSIDLDDLRAHNLSARDMTVVASNGIYARDISETTLCMRFASTNDSLIKQAYSSLGSVVLDGYLYFYKDRHRNTLMSIVRVCVMPVQAFDVLLQPGVPRRLDIRLHTDMKRQVEVITERHEIMPESKTLLLTTEAPKTLTCQVTSFSPDCEFTSYLVLYDRPASSVYKYIEINTMVKPCEPKKTIFKRVVNSKENVLYMVYYNSKRAETTFTVNTSDEDYIAPVARQFTLASQTETQVLLSVSRTLLVGKKTFFVFVSDSIFSVNDCFRVDVEFVDGTT